MKKYPILLIAWLAPGAASAGLKETLQRALGDYCIPKDEQYCAGEEKATYANGKCECNCLGMVYDSAQRRCVDGNTSCAAGYMLADSNAAACAAGFYNALASASSCEVGYYLKSDTASSCSGGFYLASGAASNGSCPAGFVSEGTARWCDLNATPTCAVGYYRTV